MRFLWLFAAALALAGCATTSVPDPVQAALDQAGLPADSLGFVLPYGRMT